MYVQMIQCSMEPPVYSVWGHTMYSCSNT